MRYRPVTLSFDLQGHPRSKVISHMNSQYMTSYWSAMVTMGLGSTVYEIQTNDLEFDLQGNGQNMLKITFPHFLSIFKKKNFFLILTISTIFGPFACKMVTDGRKLEKQSSKSVFLHFDHF